MQAVLKHISDKLSIPKALLLQYLGAAVIVTIYAVISGNLEFSTAFYIVAVIGFFQVWNAYFQWKAYKYSLSKSVLLFPLAGVIAVVLAAIFLGENKIYDGWLIAGSALLFASAVLLSFQEFGKGEKVGLRWLLYATAAISIVGVVIFMLKKFANDDIPHETFLFYYYNASLLGASVIAFIRRKEGGVILDKKALIIPVASVGIVINLATTYWIFKLVEAGVIVPIMESLVAILTLAVGLFVFKEIKNVNKLHVVGFALGIIGAGLVIFSM